MLHKQKESAFYLLFKRAFPDIKTQIEKPLMEPENFCFSIKSPNETFGQVLYDIGSEITVFSDFDHRHFNTDIYQYANNEDDKIKLVYNEVLEYTKDLINGDIIFEYEKQGNKLLSTRQYHKDHPPSSWMSSKRSAKMQSPSFLSKLISLFKRPDANRIITKRITWFGEID